MYEQFYHLASEPFRLSPDYRFCYRYSHFATVRRMMELGLHRAEGVMIVSGEPGTGKTTLVDDLVGSAEQQRILVARLVSTRMELHDLLRMVAFAIGIETRSTEADDIIAEIAAQLRALDRGGKRVLLVVDEAQHLEVQAVRELYRLSLLRGAGGALLQVLLVGQPALRQLMLSRELEDIAKAVVVTGELRPLEPRETRAYIDHRLKIAGWRGDPQISTPVYAIVHAFSRGIPRSINLICSRLLLYGCVQQRHQIRVADAREVVRELREEQLYVVNPVNESLFLAEDDFQRSAPGY
ncbi:MAG: AAA family ATPase [Halioglobus sp.]|jgi:general secretion pathway protein A